MRVASPRALSLGTPRKVPLLDLVLDDLTFPEALARCAAMARDPRPQLVFTPNVDHFVRARRDPAFRDAYRRADLVLADGMPVLWACRWLGRPLRAKVSGADLLPALAGRAAREGLPVFFLGGAPGAAAACARRLRARHPGLRVAGTACPPLGFEGDPGRNGALLARVRRARPAILFVGLGSPKQEFWLVRHREELQVPLSLGVGAALDFAAGRRRRAPRWMQRTGLEWFFRLLQEPRRLWRRYLLEDPVFFREVWRAARREKGLHAP